MDTQPSNCSTKKIRLFTDFGAVEGELGVPSGQTLMRHLNAICRTQNLITLQPPVTGGEAWTMAPGPVALALESILFVTELSEFVPDASTVAMAAHYTRAPVRMLVQKNTVEGYLHVPLGGNPMARLNQDHHPFIAVTSASVVGPELQFAAAFLGVRRAHLKAVQPLDSRPAISIDHQDREQPARS